MSGYFKNFEKITYANNLCINILQRVVPIASEFSDLNLYYPYDLTNHQRADQLASNIYQDPFQSWIIYLTNGIIDPYYQWYLNDDDFNNYLLTKYDISSIYQLQNQVMFYRNNWPDDNESILTQTFDTLDPSLWKYYKPVYGNSYIPIYYVRTQDDTTINTNMIIEYASINSSLILNEVVNITFNNTYSGNAQVLLTNSSVVTVQHCTGTLFPNTEVIISSSSYIYGTQSKSNTLFTSVTSIANNIPILENVFYEPITTYDYEVEQNEKNKSILLLNPAYSSAISTQLNTLLNN